MKLEIKVSVKCAIVITINGTNYKIAIPCTKPHTNHTKINAHISLRVSFKINKREINKTIPTLSRM